MKSSDEKQVLQHINSIIKLDCKSLPTKIHGPHIQPSRGASKVTSIATIRVLLVTFGTLQLHLGNIVKLNDVTQFYDHHKLLTNRVFPEAVFAVEYCQQALALKGATGSSAAEKLANSANKVCDYLEILRTKVSSALEYHELKYRVISDIQNYIDREDLSLADIGPLKFSLDVSLPLRMDGFASSAARVFPESVAELQGLCNDLSARAKQRINAIKIKSEPVETVQLPNVEPSKPVKGSSPKLQPLRGVRFNQPLRTLHKRIPSLMEENSSLRENVASADKENSMRQQSTKTFSGIPTQPKFDNTTSRLKKPTPIENRKLVHSYRKTSAHYSDTVPRNVTNSRIAQPTLVRTRSNITSGSFVSSPRTPSGHGFSSKSSRERTRSDTFHASYSPHLALSSPGDGALDVTPLTRKNLSSTAGKMSSSLHIPRRRSMVPIR